MWSKQDAEKKNMEGQGGGQGIAAGIFNHFGVSAHRMSAVFHRQCRGGQHCRLQAVFGIAEKFRIGDADGHGGFLGAGPGAGLVYCALRLEEKGVYISASVAADADSLHFSRDGAHRTVWRQRGLDQPFGPQHQHLRLLGHCNRLGDVFVPGGVFDAAGCVSIRGLYGV